MPDEVPDYNPMQLRLGLSPSSSGHSPVAVPTPPQGAFSILHPGQAAQNLVQQTQTAALNTMQSSSAVRAAAGGSFSPFGLGPTPPLSGAYSTFAQQYQANAAAIQAGYQQPFYAQAMASMGGYGGAPGFIPGMLPSPTQMTMPGMGIFRPFPQGMPGSIPPVPQLPLLRGPLTPNLSFPRFQAPYEYAYALNQQRLDQFSAGFVAAPGVAGRLGADVLGSHLGGGLGALLGALVGGARGAGIGAGVGSLGGMFLAEGSGLGRLAQGGVDAVNPFTMPYRRAGQIQGATTGFAVGGGDLSRVGLGLSRTASMHLGNLLTDMGQDFDFRRDTGGVFANSDLFRITQTAGQNGLLDVAQSPEAIRDSVRSLAKSLRVFMQVAHEPDVREAMKQLGQARVMGLSVPESTQMMTNARMFARMAGTTFAGLTDAGGLPGSLTFQQGGLTAGLGLQVGQGMLGLARQAVNAGAFSPQMFAMLGGTQGIAQRDTEHALALLRMPMLAAAMSSTSTAGTFGLNATNVGGLARGKFSISDMASMATNNLQAAVAKHGVGALGTFMMQQGELQDQLGRALGPVGMKTMGIRTVLDFMNNLGLSGQGGFSTAALALTGGDTNMARQLRDQASSPEFFNGLRRQLEVQRMELRAEADQRRSEMREGVLHRGARALGLAGDSNVGQAVTASIEGLTDSLSNAGEFMGSGDRMLLRTNRGLLASSSSEAANVLRFADRRRAARLGRGPDLFDYDLTYAASRATGATAIGATLSAFAGPDSAAASATVLGDKARIGRVLEHGLVASDGEIDAAANRLTGRGISRSLVAAVTRGLTDRAEGGTTLLGRNNLGEGDVKAAIQSAVRRGVISQDEANRAMSDPGVIQDLTFTAVSAARAASGNAASDRFAGSSGDELGAGRHKGAVVGAQDAQDALLEHAFGGTSSILSGLLHGDATVSGKNRNRRKLLSRVLSQTDDDAGDVSTLALLLSSSDSKARDLAEVLQRSMDPKRVNRAAGMAEEIRKLGLRDTAGEMGAQLAARNGSSGFSATADLRDIRGRFADTKLAVGMSDAVNKIFGGGHFDRELNAFSDGSSDLGSLFRQAALNPDVVSDPTARRLIAKYNNPRTTSAERTEIERQFGDLVDSRAGDTGVTNVGGGNVASGEAKQIDSVGADVTDAQLAAKKVFPDAVEDFKRAVAHFEDLLNQAHFLNPLTREN